MSINAPKDTPVWVDEKRCKACNICVSYCPAGVLAMRDDVQAVLGQMIEVVHPDSCIGCAECEVHCPDFAIMVAKRDEFKFAKLTPESKDRALAVKNNKYKKLNS
ncbi:MULTISPECIES: 4Fe-4S dicluster domain-containing protein [unclassified Campylobacter]|uniref:4Fe-4S dicluster domain-containing protein n=1 Tax=unclassified Campylobacter TaxID=2593542 RepID=UPI001237E2A9|nr:MULTISPECIES: 4Fe-4S binding protein [unclassified Campylobacter]KAA6225513.1 4Fe-4S dicluster domain-containing protein [Campylobacter sp. LR196d]KAA6226950.1 4Fe-4S dicluster domain-containing protein [Campylobacter sp. LR185c]KAA6229784.1 4Fe-4S dicluster domain-containing protein [Campylobacter sp. LR286c]KAA6234309.1 4Fe-4S dicluster domain-containing protein [Campylobacter sp. LR291e]KAA6234528.1 4Fe-4S dicluster domain-containing protein [Campylobacter sp. LR264d]